jgi:hypothetical protein
MNLLGRLGLRIVLGAMALVLSSVFWFIVTGWCQRAVEYTLGHPVIGPEDEFHWVAGLAVLILAPISTLVLVRCTEGMIGQRLKRG